MSRVLIVIRVGSESFSNIPLAWCLSSHLSRQGWLGHISQTTECELNVCFFVVVSGVCPPGGGEAKRYGCASPFKIYSQLFVLKCHFSQMTFVSAWNADGREASGRGHFGAEGRWRHSVFKGCLHCGRSSMDITLVGVGKCQLEDSWDDHTAAIFIWGRSSLSSLLCKKYCAVLMCHVCGFNQ